MKWISHASCTLACCRGGCGCSPCTPTHILQSRPASCTRGLLLQVVTLDSAGVSTVLGAWHSASCHGLFCPWRILVTKCGLGPFPALSLLSGSTPEPGTAFASSGLCCLLALDLTVKGSLFTAGCPGFPGSPQKCPLPPASGPRAAHVSEALLAQPLPTLLVAGGSTRRSLRLLPQVQGHVLPGLSSGAPAAGSRWLPAVAGLRFCVLLKCAWRCSQPLEVLKGSARELLCRR